MIVINTTAATAAAVRDVVVVVVFGLRCVCRGGGGGDWLERREARYCDEFGGAWDNLKRVLDRFVAVDAHESLRRVLVIPEPRRVYKPTIRLDTMHVLNSERVAHFYQLRAVLHAVPVLHQHA
eukprot:CAMPEP_0185845610 /NCGR_PEP_ID=MMETSP1354-20130828/1524_1 /TAXON_ID=708628 /ORGANISM="Erythrolobus madagascarensis, Strain CCMP3276" /LENGTH=122 /DNA_ID=CAMNT_0028545605 /DNA_START=498 /DNA_END=862 /DNA_ORIENTATION=+